MQSIEQITPHPFIPWSQRTAGRKGARAVRTVLCAGCEGWTVQKRNLVTIQTELTWLPAITNTRCVQKEIELFK